MHRLKLALLAVCIALSAAAKSPAAATEDIPPAVLRALQAYNAQLEGIVVFDRHYASRIKYPGTDEQKRFESTRLRDGKKIVAVKLHRMLVNGKPASDADLEKEQAIAEKALPYEAAQEFPLGGLLSGTRYDSSLPCECPQDVVMFPFHALVKDEGHGSGTLYVDLAGGRIVKADFTPAVYPKPATAGSTTITFGNAGGGMWDIVRIDEHFSGSKYLIKGTFEATIVHENYRRAASIDEAKRALLAER